MIKNIVLITFLFFSSLYGISKEEVVRQIQNILSSLPKETTAGIMIYNPLTQDTIFFENHQLSMIPASITKLFTTSTSLSIMGGDHKLSTKFFTDDQNLNDGVINGNIYLKGFGNPLFTDSDLNELINTLVQIGIKEIIGDVIGDDTFFDNVYTRDDWIENENANVKLPPISAIVLDRNQTTVRRKIRRRYRYVTETVKDPPLFIAKRFREKLITSAITFNGKSKKGVTPDNAKLISAQSIPLNELIAYINKHSDNFLAECLFKTLGAEANGLQGNSFYSQQAILKFLKENNVYSIGTEIVDGSGISRFDQVTPAAITGVLEKMYFDLVHFEDFYNSLSIAGVDGTLSRRMVGTSAENKFRGKTGTLNGVSGIAGYLEGADGEELVITILMEFKKGSWKHYRNVQDKIIILLADWKKESSN